MGTSSTLAETSAQAGARSVTAVQPDEQAAIERRVWLRIVFFVPVMGLLLFVPAGTMHYWPAWLYLAVTMVPMLATIRYFLRRDPGFLARRMNMKEKELTQRRLLVVSLPVNAALFIVPGLDHRFGWSAVPLWLVLASNVIVFLSYVMILWVFHYNRFAGRTIEVLPEQTVISTGPYALVRHPMYLATLALILATPLALGSYWAILGALAMPVLLVVRIRNEEQVLRRELAGYPEYMGRVRYRLLPGIW